MQTISILLFSLGRQFWFYAVLLLLLLIGQTPIYAKDQPTATPVEQKSAATSAVPKDKAALDDKEEAKENAQAEIENSMDNVEIIQKTLSSLRKEIEASKKGAVLNRTTIKDGLELISNQIKEIHEGLDKMNTSINSHSLNLDKIKNDISSLQENIKDSVSTLEQKVSTSTSNVNSQKFLIENYAAGGYEILLRMDDLSVKLDKLSQGQSLQNDQKQNQRISMIKDLDRLWRLLAIILASFTPVAFIFIYTKDTQKNLSDGVSQQQGMLLVCLAAFLSYFIVGFGLMFGTSLGGLIGASSYIFKNTVGDNASAEGFPAFFLYQVSFVLLAVLIIYNIVGNLFSSKMHMLLAVFVAILVVPIFGHWTHAGEYLNNNHGWLESAGFIDAGGSTTVHSLAAWFAMMIIWKLGAQKPQSAQNAPVSESEWVYPIGAIMFLWISTLGLTTGNLSISNGQIMLAMLNVGLAAFSAALVAYLHHIFFQADNKEQAAVRGLNGFVTGLVAIAAAAPNVYCVEAITIGIGAGVMYVQSVKLLRKYVLKQAWQLRAVFLIAIHGGGGVWGTLCVFLFSSEGLFTEPHFNQLTSQLETIFIAFIYSIGLASVVLFGLSRHKKKIVVLDLK